MERRIARYDGALAVAVVNGPGSVAVAGPDALLTAWVQAMTAEGLRCRRLPVDYGAHSRHVEPAVAGLGAALAELVATSAALPMYSTVTGALVDGEALDARYWCRNVREPVRLDRAVAAAFAEGRRVFIEVGPHPLLTGAIAATVPEAIVGRSLRRDEGGRAALLAALAELHVAGLAIDWRRVFGTAAPLADRLPTYAFQRRRHWLTRRATGADGAGLAHPILRARVDLPGGQVVLATLLLAGLAGCAFVPGDHAYTMREQSTVKLPVSSGGETAPANVKARAPQLHPADPNLVMNLIRSSSASKQLVDGRVIER